MEIKFDLGNEHESQWLCMLVKNLQAEAVRFSISQDGRYVYVKIGAGQ